MAFLSGLPLLLACGGTPPPVPQKAPALPAVVSPVPSVPAPDLPVPTPPVAVPNAKPVKHAAPAPEPIPAPVISSFKASPASIIAGKEATLAWSVEGATKVSIDPGVGEVLEDTVAVSPTKDAVYTLTATNASGSVTATAVVAVKPPKPSIGSFAASPESITMGQGTTLSWAVSGATGLSIDQGVGTVTGASATVMPMITTVYTLTATNPTGSSTATAHVVALGPPGPARTGHTATLLFNGKILIAGGEATGGFTPTADLYDPTSGSVTPTGSMHTARSAHTATLLPDGKVLIMGGQTSGGFAKAGELYNPLTGSFSVVDAAPRPAQPNPALHMREAVSFGFQFNLTPVVSGGGNLSSKSGHGFGVLFPSAWVGDSLALCPKVDYLDEKRTLATYPALGSLSMQAETLLVLADLRYYPLPLHRANTPDGVLRPYLFVGVGFNKTVREARLVSGGNTVNSNTTGFAYNVGLGLMIARPIVVEIRYVGYKLPDFQWNTTLLDPGLSSKGLVGSIGLAF